MYLAVNCSPPHRSETNQYKSADLNHNSACPASRGPCSRVPPVPVPLVNNRKGSLLPPAVPSALRPVGVPVVPPRRRPAATVAAAAAGEVNRIQRAHSLPVKYRYHSGHPSNATLSHQHRKPPATPHSVWFGGHRAQQQEACACQAAALACEAFLTNDPASAAVSCETLNIEQAAGDVKGQRVAASLRSGSPPNILQHVLL